MSLEDSIKYPVWANMKEPDLRKIPEPIWNAYIKILRSTTRDYTPEGKAHILRKVILEWKDSE